MTQSDESLSILWRSAAFRLAATQAAIFALLVAGLFAVTWWSVNVYVEQKIHSAAVDELREVAADIASLPADPAGGVRVDPEATEHVGLFDAAGRRLSGDITVLPVSTGNILVQLIGSGEKAGASLRVHSVQARLADGRMLVVGVERHSADELRELLGRVFLIACLAGVVAALVAGFLTSRRYLRRIDAISAAAALIEEGRLETRLPVRGRHDEIDRLSVSLNATWQRIESLLEGMRQLSTDMAHELRTPLAHLRFRLEAARTGIVDATSARAVIDRSIEDVDHVLALFGALLRIAQIQSRQRRAGFEVIDLSGLVVGVAADYRPLFEDEGRALDADIASDVELFADRTLLTQCLVNLVENALRHTPRGVPVTLRLARDRDVIEMSVSDAGPGVPMEQRERVLQRLVRLDAARGGTGAGLGLALVKAIADLHEARLELSDGNPGLTVKLVFPVSGLTDK